MKRLGALLAFLAVVSCAVGLSLAASTSGYRYDGTGTTLDADRDGGAKGPPEQVLSGEAPPGELRTHRYDPALNLARASARLADPAVAPRAISAGDEVAPSAAQGARLSEHLRLTERYGAGGVRELADGRIRYYGELTPAAKPGGMAGARLVREWNPAADRYRTWYETLDLAGRVRQVHPYQPYSPNHYWFDEFGNYGGPR